MKVMLINPGSSQIEKSWAYRKFFTPIPPLGLAYMAGMLEKDGFEVLLVDHFALKWSDRVLIDFVERERPDVVGFAALTPVMPDVARLSSLIKSSCRKTRIVAGHIHATCFPEEVLEDGVADIVVRGEGEMTIVEICRRLRDGMDTDDVAGISFIPRAGGAVRHNPDRELIADLDSLPFPAWHLVEADKYRQAPLLGVLNTRAFPILASRGCNYRCYYCSQDKLYNKVRYRNLDRVVEEMDYFQRTNGIGFFGFCDAYFPFDEDSGLRFCELMMEKGLHKKVTWSTETRVDKVTPRLLQAMKKAGAHLIMYGVEVGNPGILGKLNKGTTLEQAESAIYETRRAGILSQGLFILGLPGETEQTCRETMRFARKLDCDFAKFNLAVPYPGSRFFEDFRDTGAAAHPERFTSWYDWTQNGGRLMYVPEGMDGDTLRLLQRRAMFFYYMRPRLIFRHLLKGTIGLRNFLFGGLWLISLLFTGIIKEFGRIRRPDTS